MSEIRRRLKDGFRWHSDPSYWSKTTTFYADYSSWWRDPFVLEGIGPALADLFQDAHPTAILGTESQGFLLGPLVARHLGIGFVAVHKGAQRASHDDRWWVRTTPPDYRDRHLELAVRRSVLQSTDRVLFVDEWASSGGQALACQQLVHDASATWIGASVIVDALENSADRRKLSLRGVLHVRELPHR